MLPFEGGTAYALDTLAEAMARARDDEGVEGISLLGGEPVAHFTGAIALAERARAAALSVMVYSGYTIEEIRAAGAGRLLDVTDVLVDGPYLRDRPEPRRRWVGSANQRVHLLTPRYAPDDPCWTRPNTLEIRLRGGEVTVNGFPAASAAPFWRRPPVARVGHD
jgi:anaerobic ribonucleoside-triphosphate reductase activating protein